MNQHQQEQQLVSQQEQFVQHQPSQEQQQQQQQLIEQTNFNQQQQQMSVQSANQLVAGAGHTSSSQNSVSPNSSSNNSLGEYLHIELRLRDTPTLNAFLADCAIEDLMERRSEKRRYEFRVLPLHFASSVHSFVARDEMFNGLAALNLLKRHTTETN